MRSALDTKPDLPLQTADIQISTLGQRGLQYRKDPLHNIIHPHIIHPRLSIPIDNRRSASAFHPPKSPSPQ